MRLTSVELKEQTKIAHQLLEAKMVRKIKAVSHQHEYGELLGLFFSFFTPIESEVNKYLEHDGLFNLPGRRKAGLLKTDLLNFDQVLPSLAGKADLPVIENRLQAMGAMYVMEGSTMGGAMIIKMMVNQLGNTNLPGTSFFEGYKGETLLMWDRFKMVIDEQVISTEDQQAVISAANQTFDCFSDWFNSYNSALAAD